MVAGFLSIGVDDEQQAVDRIGDFLVNTVGWTIAQDVTDSPTDRDLVFQSDGEYGAGNTNTRYIRLRGTGNGVWLYTYETFTDVYTNTGEVSDPTYGYVATEADAGGFSLIVVADLERVVVHVTTYDSAQYMGYVGRIKPYASAAQHPYPNLVKGSYSQSPWWYSSAPRNSWMRAPDGTVQHYYGLQVQSDPPLRNYMYNYRNGKYFFTGIPLVSSSTDANKELPGEPRGVYYAGSYGPLVTDRLFTYIGGRPFISLSLNNEYYMVGPVTQGSTLPSLSTPL